MSIYNEDEFKIDTKEKYKEVKELFYLIKKYLRLRFSLRNGFFSPKLLSYKYWDNTTLCSLRYCSLKINKDEVFTIKSLTSLLSFNLCKMYNSYIFDGRYDNLPYNKFCFQKLYNGLSEIIDIDKIEFIKDFIKFDSSIELDNEYLNEFIVYLNKEFDYNLVDNVCLRLSNGSEFEPIINWLFVNSDYGDISLFITPVNGILFKDIPIRIYNDGIGIFMVFENKYLNNFIKYFRSLVKTRLDIYL